MSVSVSFKGLFSNFAKLGLVVILLYYLFSSGKLDLSQLNVFHEDIRVLLANIGLWIIGVALLANYRWHLILKSMNIFIPFQRTVSLGLTGVFFNTVAPGAVGGDVIKAFYMFREHKEQRTAAMLSILLDRIMGLYGIFVVAACAMPFASSNLFEHVALVKLSYVVLALFFTSSLALLSIWILPMKWMDTVLYFFNKPLPLFSQLRKILLALLLLRRHPWRALKSVGLSVLLQSLIMGFYLLVIQSLTGKTLLFFDFALVYPIGAIAIALPISPGGIGVGHVAFDSLFLMLGIQGGANFFNIFFIGQSTLHLLGLFPYVMLRKHRGSLTQAHQLPSS